MTTKEVIYTLLRENANEWVSANRFVDAGSGWRYGARIYDLRQAGHVIEERPSKTSAVSEYRLVIEDVAPGQIPLPLGRVA